MLYCFVFEDSPTIKYIVRLLKNVPALIHFGNTRKLIDRTLPLDKRCLCAYWIYRKRSNMKSRFSDIGRVEFADVLSPVQESAVKVPKSTSARLYVYCSDMSFTKLCNNNLTVLRLIYIAIFIWCIQLLRVTYISFFCFQQVPIDVLIFMKTKI